MYNHAQVDSVAEAYLELLAARGIDYFFGNGGTDFAPIIEAYAKRLSQEQTLPRPIPVPHEVTAVSMAHGYTMITGKPQVVMVHTVPGTANAIGGIVNAARAKRSHALQRWTHTPHRGRGAGLTRREHSLGSGVLRPGGDGQGMG